MLSAAQTRPNDILSAIGNTPLIELPRLTPRPGVRLMAKIEAANPTGSIKDRVAQAMIDAAEESGELWPGRAILEPSSGNTGIALAMIGRVRGYPVTIVLPASSTPERVQLLRLYGANVVFSPGEQGSNGSVVLARELAAADPSLYMPFQYANPANPEVHYRTTAAEILADCPDVDVLVAGLGTGGTLMGCGRRLREANRNVQIVAAEPLPGDNVSGLRSLDEGYVPEILDVSALDRKMLVSNEDALRGVRVLARREGLFAGVSSGAVYSVGRRIAEELEGPATIVMVFADGGAKYLSGDLWGGDEAEVLDQMENRLWW